MSYCTYVNSLKEGEQIEHKIYHDTQYGFPIDNDDELFGRLILEINQAGLSWTTILKKVENFRNAYSNFSIEKIASYNEKDFNRLMQDAGIIRNRLKINAAIYNANQILCLQKEFGSFKNWLDIHKSQGKLEWIKLFKKQFHFTGGEIVNEFLMSTGYLSGAHDADCWVLKNIKKI
ncbi:MAG: DNA-3-methyladenine glycosylase I [Bacteroidota bacterium]